MNNIDEKPDKESPLSMGTVVTGVIAVTLAGGIAGVISHGQQIAGLTEATREHDVNDGLVATAMQAQLDRRFTDIHGDLVEIRAQFDRGRQERMGADDSLAKRVDDLNSRLAEVQRQLSAIEGKLGESKPDKVR